MEVGAATETSLPGPVRLVPSVTALHELLTAPSHPRVQRHDRCDFSDACQRRLRAASNEIDDLRDNNRALRRDNARLRDELKTLYFENDRLHNQTAALHSRLVAMSRPIVMDDSGGRSDDDRAPDPNASPAIARKLYATAPIGESSPAPAPVAPPDPPRDLLAVATVTNLGTLTDLLI